MFDDYSADIYCLQINDEMSENEKERRVERLIDSIDSTYMKHELSTDEYNELMDELSFV